MGYIGSQCPTNTPVICKRDTDEEPQGCCPQGQFCKTTISEVYCCPSGRSLITSAFSVLLIAKTPLTSD